MQLRSVTKQDFTLFDYQIRKVKQNPCSIDQEKFKKWQDYGFDPELYYKNADFTAFFFDSLLGSQMKLTKTNEIREIDNEPALRVDGNWVKASDFLEQFEVREDATYNEKFIFKKGTDLVYTYTDTGAGLVCFHPYQVGLSLPISHLDQTGYNQVLDVAQKFVREGEAHLSPEELAQKQAGRTCILQIVSSQINENKKHNFLTKNFFKLLINRKHPWIRLIEPTPAGASVYGLGFGYEKAPSQVLETVTGRFRSIDTWEYTPAKRIVTNIAVTPAEFQMIQGFPEKYIQEGRPIGFQLMTQNCSVAVKEVIKEATGIRVPTEIGTGSLLMRISPDFFRKFIYKMDTARGSIRSLIGRIKFIRAGYELIRKKIVMLYKSLVAFNLSLLSVFLGAGKEEKNVQKIEANAEEPTLLESPVKNTKNWYDLSGHKFNMPGILQEWQEKQPSTVIYEKGYKGFSIVPPEAL